MINLKGLNQYVKVEHLEMEGLYTRADPSRGVDGKARFERCLPQGPYPSKSSEISGISE